MSLIGDDVIAECEPPAFTPGKYHSNKVALIA
jgi:hypothetical protein